MLGGSCHSAEGIERWEVADNSGLAASIAHWTEVDNSCLAVHSSGLENLDRVDTAHMLADHS